MIQSFKFNANFLHIDGINHFKNNIDYVYLFTQVRLVKCRRGPLKLFVYFTDQRNMGMSMKVERSSLDQVKARFAQNKKKLEEKKKDYDLDERLAEQREEVRTYKYEHFFIREILL